jgi:transposase
MSDAEWALVEPHLLAAKRLGRPRRAPCRAVVEAALLYLAAHRLALAPAAARFSEPLDGAVLLLRLAGGRALANHQFPAAATVFADWLIPGLDPAGGLASRPARSRAKKVKGRKRHIIADTLGHLVAAWVDAANIQDRDGAPPCWPRSAICSRDCATSSPLLAFRCCRAVGWSSEPSPG